MLTFEQFRALVDDSLDVGFTAAPQSYPSGLTGFIVDRQPYYLAIPEGHPLAARKHITPAMLVDETFVAVSLEMEVGFGGGNIAAISPLGVTPRIVERAPDIFSVLTLVAAGVGISVLSQPLTNIKIPRHRLSQNRRHQAHVRARSWSTARTKARRWSRRSSISCARGPAR